MTMLTREELLKPAPRRYLLVDLPDGRRARIRNLTELEKSDYEASVLDAKCAVNPRELRRHRLRLVIACVVDDAGYQLFTESDLPALGLQDGAVMHVLSEACRKHCGFDEHDLEDLAKNSAGTAGSDSPTGSA